MKIELFTNRQLKTTFFNLLAYWTDKEKKELEKAIINSKNGSFTLSKHNFKSSGLELLNEIADNKNELTIGIE